MRPVLFSVLLAISLPAQAASVLVRQGARVRLLRLELPEGHNVSWSGLRISAAPERMTGDRTPVPVTLTDERP